MTGKPTAVWIRKQWSESLRNSTTYADNGAKVRLFWRQ